MVCEAALGLGIKGICQVKDMADSEFVLENDLSEEDVVEKDHEADAVEAVNESTVPRQRICKVFDLERAFESRGKKAYKRSH